MSGSLLQVFRATNIYGEVCHFGVESAARAWAKSGSVVTITVRTPAYFCSVPAHDDAIAIKDLSKTLVDVIHERDALKAANKDLQSWFDAARDDAAKANDALQLYKADRDFAHRLAVMLECVLLGGKGTWDAGHTLLDEYREACRIESNEVATCMGEPVTDVRAHVRATCFMCGHPEHAGYCVNVAP